MKKKILAMLLVAVMVVSMLPVTALAIEACVDGEHDWRATGTGASGYKYCYKAGCDVKCYHNGTLEVVKVINCKNNSGKKWSNFICTVCSYSYSGANGDGVDHEFSDDKPTCANCDQKNPNYCDHKWNTDGNCTLGCGTTCSHNYERTIPECGPNKSIVDKCSICNKMVVVGPAQTAHTVPNNATGTVTCSVCNATVEIKEPCANHLWGTDGKCTNDDCDEECPHAESELSYRDCVQSQYDHMVCTACGVTTNRTVAKERSTHTYENKVCIYCGEDEPEEECTHEKWKIDGTCDNCGVEHDHTYEDVIPNCTQGGYLNQHCNGCGHTILGEVAEKKNHTYNDNGICTVCGAEKDKCEHDWNWATGQCKKDGCGEYHIHSEADITIDHPDCTEGGYIREICGVCGHILVKSHFQAADHDYANGICTRCGALEPVVDEPDDEPAVDEPVAEVPAATQTASTEDLDDVPKTGSFFLEWLYSLIFG